MESDQEVRTAIQLKEQIEEASSYDPIGNWECCDEGDEEDSDEDEGEDENKEEQNELEPKTKKQKNDGFVKRTFSEIEHLMQPLKAYYETDKYLPSFCLPGEIRLNEKVLHKGDLFDLTQEQVEEMYMQCDVSKYGNVQNQTNETNEEVKKAKECTTFDVDPGVLATLHPKLINYLAYEIVPYKINIYGPGGHFKAHKDTPQQNMIATLLISLYNTQDGNPHLSLKKGSAIWNGTKRSFCIFYPDIIHSVKKHKTPSYRVILACKVMVKNNTPQPSVSEDVEQKLVSLMSKWKPNFGFLFCHEYSLTEMNAWKLQDRLLLNACQKLAQIKHIKCELVPVLLHHYCDGDDCTESKEVHFKDDIQIYAILKKHRFLSNIIVYQPSGGNYRYRNDYSKGYVMREDSDLGAEYTGNESRPAYQDSLYVNMLLCLHDQKDPNNLK